MGCYSKKNGRAQEVHVHIQMLPVTPSYFAAERLRLKAGRRESNDNAVKAMILSRCVILLGTAFSGLRRRA